MSLKKNQIIPLQVTISNLLEFFCLTKDRCNFAVPGLSNILNFFWVTVNHTLSISYISYPLASGDIWNVGIIESPLIYTIFHEHHHTMNIISTPWTWMEAPFFGYIFLFHSWEALLFESSCMDPCFYLSVFDFGCTAWVQIFAP